MKKTKSIGSKNTVIKAISKKFVRNLNFMLRDINRDRKKKGQKPASFLALTHNLEVKKVRSIK